MRPNGEAIPRWRAGLLALAGLLLSTPAAAQVETLELPPAELAPGITAGDLEARTACLRVVSDGYENSGPPFVLPHRCRSHPQTAIP